MILFVQHSIIPEYLRLGNLSHVNRHLFCVYHPPPHLGSLLLAHFLSSREPTEISRT